MYATYDFYLNNYSGSLITDEPEFLKYAPFACDLIDAFTFDSACDATEPRIKEKIGKAACKLADLLKETNQIRAALGYRENDDGTVQPGLVTSKSAGNESISYSSAGSSHNGLALAVAKGPAELHRYYYEAVRVYLTGTGLLYAGMG